MAIETGKDDSTNNCMRRAVYEQWNVISLNFVSESNIHVGMRKSYKNLKNHN